MNIKLKLEYYWGNPVIVPSIDKNEPYIHRNILETYKTLVDLAIEKLNKLEGQNPSTTRR